MARSKTLLYIVLGLAASLAVTWVLYFKGATGEAEVAFTILIASHIVLLFLSVLKEAHLSTYEIPLAAAFSHGNIELENLKRQVRASLKEGMLDPLQPVLKSIIAERFFLKYGREINEVSDQELLDYFKGDRILLAIVKGESIKLEDDKSLEEVLKRIEGWFY